jgi:hypothetical protein
MGQKMRHSCNETIDIGSQSTTEKELTGMKWDFSFHCILPKPSQLRPDGGISFHSQLKIRVEEENDDDDDDDDDDKFFGRRTCVTTKAEKVWIGQRDQKA